jgi:hypothetical protein
MRKMKSNNSDAVVNVVEHIIVKNWWEYFVTDRKESEDIAEAVVLGFEVEQGDVSLSEIHPHIISRTRDLDGVLPAPGWEWVD